MKRKHCQGSQTVVGVAWYRPEQWERLLEISADRAELESTHAEWERNAKLAMEWHSRGGLRLERVAVDVEELLRWCLIRNLPVDGEARSLFVSEKLRRRDATPR